MQQYNMVINGDVITSEQFFDVINPATGEAFAQCASANKAIVDKAVSSAKAAFPAWRDTEDKERVRLVNELAQVLEKNMPELMTLITKESGKPLNGLNGIGSGMELGASIAWTQVTGMLPIPVDTIQDDDVAKVNVFRKPLGVVASVTPWNWPLMIAIWHVMPALRTGNTVVIKPSPLTPVATTRFVELANTILPSGVLNVVNGENDVGVALTSHTDVAKIIFTGSTATGKKIMQVASANLKRLTLELGGNDAGILLPDFDIENNLEKLFTACFHNNGQTCACLKRLYVHDTIYDQVSQALANRANTIKVGDGLNEDTELGPVQNPMQLAKVKELTDDAISIGAKLLAGGITLDNSGFFFKPTIFSDITDGSRLVDEEQFGPVLPIIRYSDIDEVIERSNKNEAGLGGSVWSSDIEKAQQVASRMETGTVWINDHGAVQPDAPFGGVKQSGFGTEFGEAGLEEYLSLQTIKVCK
jgi:acyl-CoA reductase-like NAD-dependent aldehyde dehydrogenase